MESSNPWLKRYPDIVPPDSQDSVGLRLQDIRNIHMQAYDRMDDVEDGLQEDTDDDELTMSRHDIAIDVPVTAAPWYIDTSKQDSDDNLCKFCSHIDFTWLLHHEISPRDGAVLLLQDMLANAHTCAFCRLAVTALRNANDAAHSEDLQDVEATIYCPIYSTCLRHYSQGPYLTISRRHLFKKGRDVGKPALIQKIDNDDDRCLGRHIDASMANVGLIKSWIKACERDHKDQFDMPESSLDFVNASRFRDLHNPSNRRRTIHVIDLLEKCISVIEPSTRYAVLSYVWGAAEQLRLLTSNYSDLTSKGSLEMDHYGARIPRTIRDAMELTVRLGERFLWVDALCLVQDGPNFAEEVLRMDRVYSEAIWCLVAGSAQDANTPLSRVRNEGETQRTYQHIETVRGKTLAVMLPSLAVYLHSTRWNTRAWTYQESVLSARLLIVADAQTYFTCHHGFAFYEDRAFEFSVKQASYRPEGHIYGVQHQSNLEVYAGAVSGYTSRQLSFPEDAIKAFSGILSKLQVSFRGKFLFGLPSTELDQALLWYPIRDHLRRKDRKGEDLFPSWSWTGWVGRVHYVPELALSRVRWKDYNSGEHFTSDELRAPPTVPYDTRWHRNTWVPVRSNSDKGWLQFFHERYKPDALYLHPIAPEYTRKDYTLLHGTQRLEFRALTCWFHVSKKHCDPYFSMHPCDETHHLCALEITNSLSEVVGTVHIPGSISSTLQAGNFEFIRLSRTRLVLDSSVDKPQEAEEIEGAECRKNTDVLPPEPSATEQVGIDLDQDDAFECDTRAFDLSIPWCVYNVMLVQTTDGISRRLGLGKVHVDAFLRASTTWRDVSLE
ncbi:hypothetical protein N0V90_000497 [Kalmusia sp. IMI 367209]|nr:hypothetical protein N0V90_000497 [Kalmusia sp. IMI 367209]